MRAGARAETMNENKGVWGVRECKELRMQGEFHFKLLASLDPFSFISLQTLIKYGEEQFSNASVAYLISRLYTVCFESCSCHIP
jgi:hypothetical protein